MTKISLVLAVLALVGFAAVSFGEEPAGAKEEKGSTGGMMGKEMMEHKGMMGGEHKGMMGHGMMCPLCSSMMERQVVATGDGGFVVILGSKAMKYDKDLNVVKETELKMDVQGMMDKMKDCPMCKMMKEKMGDKKDMMMEHADKMMEKKEETK